MPDFGWDDEDVVGSEVNDDPKGESGDNDPEHAIGGTPLSEVESEDTLREAWLTSSGAKKAAIKDRLHALGSATPTESGEQSTLPDNAESATDGGVTAEDVGEGDDTEDEKESNTGDSDATEGTSDPFAHLAGGSMTREEATEKKTLRRVLVWGPPGVGKTHFAYTAPKPIAFLDTEGKAHDISEKFEGQVRLWQPDNYDEARDALEEALTWLQAWLDERDRRGTLVVDSMSDMWEWAKQHHIMSYYVEKDPTINDPADVELKSSIGGGESDWKPIKNYHNEKFRKQITQSPFHSVWTAQAVDDYGEKIKQGMQDPPMKPHGESKNDFKVNFVLHVSENHEGIPTAILEKSGLTKHTFRGLAWPTWGRVFSTVEGIKTAELSDEDVPAHEATEHDVSIVEGKATRIKQKEEDADD